MEGLRPDQPPSRFPAVVGSPPGRLFARHARPRHGGFRSTAVRGNGVPRQKPTPEQPCQTQQGHRPPGSALRDLRAARKGGRAAARVAWRVRLRNRRGFTALGFQLDHISTRSDGSGLGTSRRRKPGRRPAEGAEGNPRALLCRRHPRGRKAAFRRRGVAFGQRRFPTASRFLNTAGKPREPFCGRGCAVCVARGRHDRDSSSRGNPPRVRPVRFGASRFVT